MKKKRLKAHLKAVKKALRAAMLELDGPPKTLEELMEEPLRPLDGGVGKMLRVQYSAQLLAEHWFDSNHSSREAYKARFLTAVKDAGLLDD